MKRKNRFDGKHCFNCGVEYDLTTHHHPSKHYCKYYDTKEKKIKKITVILCRNCHDLLHHDNKIPTIISQKLKKKLLRIKPKPKQSKEEG